MANSKNKDEINQSSLFSSLWRSIVCTLSTPILDLHVHFPIKFHSKIDIVQNSMKKNTCQQNFSNTMADYHNLFLNTMTVNKRRKEGDKGRMNSLPKAQLFIHKKGAHENQIRMLTMKIFIILETLS
uniref:Uncharacterized protein n=1 Tax=Romanomermis culicivorax TaxID=13658 RepID=A0A915KUJ6_ROMCU